MSKQQDKQYGVMRMQHFTGYGNRCCMEDTTHITAESAVREARNDVSDVVCVFEIDVRLCEIRTLYSREAIEDMIERDERAARIEAREDRIYGTYEEQVQSLYYATR